MLNKIRRFYPPMLDGLTLAIMLGMIGYVLFHYGKLPEEIPIHFNMEGEADNWGSKGTIFGLIFINFLVVALLFVLNYFLVIKSEDTKDNLAMFNIPFVKKDQLTNEQVYIIKRHTARMLALMNLMISLLFATIYYDLVQAALGHAVSISSSVGVMLVLIFVPLFYYTWKIFEDAKRMNQG